MSARGRTRLASGTNHHTTCIPGDRLSLAGAETATWYCQTSQTIWVANVISEKPR